MKFFLFVFCMVRDRQLMKLMLDVEKYLATISCCLNDLSRNSKPMRRLLPVLIHLLSVISRQALIRSQMTLAID